MTSFFVRSDSQMKYKGIQYHKKREGREETLAGEPWRNAKDYSTPCVGWDSTQADGSLHVLNKKKRVRAILATSTRQN